MRPMLSADNSRHDAAISTVSNIYTNAATRLPLVWSKYLALRHSLVRTCCPIAALFQY